MPSKLPEALAANIVFANGPTHPRLGAQVAKLLGIEIFPVEYKRYADTQSKARYEQTIRGKQVIAFQTHAPVEGYPVSDSFYEHLSMCDAAVRSHAHSVMAVAPNFAGTRQDRQAEPRESVNADLNLDLLRTAGATHFVTVDIHDPRTLNSFRKPGVTDQLTAQPMLRDKLAQLMVYDRDKYVMVSPDVGHSKATEIHAEALGIRIADSMYKKRNPTDGRVTHKGNVDDVDGRICFLMDDMIGTASTVASATEKLDQAGASDIYVAATHGWFSGSAAERLSDSPIVEIFVTDTIPIAESVQQRLGDKLQIVSAAQLIADGLAEILTGGSVSELYEGQNYA